MHQHDISEMEMGLIFEWVSENKEWLFSGIGVLAISTLGWIARCLWFRPSATSAHEGGTGGSAEVIGDGEARGGKGGNSGLFGPGGKGGDARVVGTGKAIGGSGGNGK